MPAPQRPRSPAAPRHGVPPGPGAYFAFLLSGTDTPVGTPCRVSAHPGCFGAGPALRVPKRAAEPGWEGTWGWHGLFSLLGRPGSSRRRRGSSGLPRPRTGSGRTKGFAAEVGS